MSQLCGADTNHHFILSRFLNHVVRGEHNKWLFYNVMYIPLEGIQSFKFKVTNQVEEEEEKETAYQAPSLSLFSGTHCKSTVKALTGENQKLQEGLPSLWALVSSFVLLLDEGPKKRKRKCPQCWVGARAMKLT